MPWDETRQERARLPICSYDYSVARCVDDLMTLTANLPQGKESLSCLAGLSVRQDDMARLTGMQTS